MNLFRKAALSLAVVAAVVAPTTIALSQASPNSDPVLAAVASKLRTDATDLNALADQVDGYAPPTTTTTTTLPPTTTTPPTTVGTQGTPRTAALWPFAVDSPWNTPRGDGAIFDSRSVLGNGGVNINTVAYGVTVNGAGYSSPPQVGFELATVNITGAHTANETTAFISPAVVNVDLTGSGVNQTVTGNGSQYLRATKLDLLGGTLRSWELQAAANGDIHAIKHAIAIGASSQVLSKTYAWPAFAEDSFAGSNTGFMPEGGFMAAPSGSMPAGLNNVAQAIWQAEHDYGAYAVDATGQGGGLTIVEMESAADSFANTIRGSQIAGVVGALRWVTNSSQTQVGGPGARLAPSAPPIG